MKAFFSDPVTRFRYTGYAEGISFLVLLFVAMPLKYMADFDLAVKYVGWAHGVLFMAYLFFLLEIKQVLNWPFSKLIIGFIACIIPFGPFLLEKRLLGSPAVGERF